VSIPDYAAYLPGGRVADPWGVSLEAAGHTCIRPGTAYPPAPNRHPDDHLLTWARGRVLSSYQIVYISQGKGLFESSRSGRRQITEWTAFLLFPGVWHRYEPRQATGWVEDWIELRGAAMDRLMRSGVITPRRPVFHIGPQPEIMDAFRQCHEAARALPPGYHAVLGTMGLQILARILAAAATTLRNETRVGRSIRRAQTIIADAASRALAMEEVAEQVGMSYSYFRRAFKARTGLAPKQYHLQARLRRAQEMLTNTAWPVRHISSVLAFDSPFHLSADFKARTGMSPTQWRARLAAGGCSIPKGNSR
jgi:AraC-like DNA-binding protein